jgi:hypothetical protein
MFELTVYVRGEGLLVSQTREDLGWAFAKAWSDGQASTVEEAVDVGLQLANPSVKWSAPYSI